MELSRDVERMDLIDVNSSSTDIEHSAPTPSLGRWTRRAALFGLPFVALALFVGVWPYIGFQTSPSVVAGGKDDVASAVINRNTATGNTALECLAKCLQGHDFDICNGGCIQANADCGLHCVPPKCNIYTQCTSPSQGCTLYCTARSKGDQMKKCGEKCPPLIGLPGFHSNTSYSAKDDVKKVAKPVTQKPEPEPKEQETKDAPATAAPVSATDAPTTMAPVVGDPVEQANADPDAGDTGRRRRKHHHRRRHWR